MRYSRNPFSKVPLLKHRNKIAPSIFPVDRIGKRLHMEEKFVTEGKKSVYNSFHAMTNFLTECF